jgi:hypothetical protein
MNFKKYLILLFFVVFICNEDFFFPFTSKDSISLSLSVYINEIGAFEISPVLLLRTSVKGASLLEQETCEMIVLLFSSI